MRRTRSDFTYLVARDLIDSFAKAIDMLRPKVLLEIPGASWRASYCCTHSWNARRRSYWRTTSRWRSGTGLVQIAPGQGKEDFITGLRYGLPIIQPIGPAGIYGPEAGPFAGKSIHHARTGHAGTHGKDGTLLAQETILHQYPHCWRCRDPLICPRHAAMVSCRGGTHRPRAGGDRRRALAARVGEGAHCRRW